MTSESENELKQLKEKIESLESELKYTLSTRSKNRAKGKYRYKNWYNANRNIYEYLINKHTVCCYCNEKMVRGEIGRGMNGQPTFNNNHPTLDHLLPKSLFPEYADMHFNFVICCWKCNKNKGVKFSSILPLFSKRVIKRIVN